MNAVRTPTSSEFFYNYYKSKLKNVTLDMQMNSEQKAENIFVAPADAKSLLVAGYRFYCISVFNDLN